MSVSKVIIEHDGTVRWKYADAHKYGEALCSKLGIRSDDANILLDCLLDADLRGVDTHGLRLLPLYEKRLLSGAINCKANIKLVKETPVSALIDADHGLGQVSSTIAMRLAIEKAKAAGVGIVSVYHSNHNGAAAHYTRMAQAENLIGFAATGGSPRIPAPGGKTAVVGNNPYSYAFPNESGKLPICFDMANSVVSAGRIMQYTMRGEKIPLNWALDKDGNPTDNGDTFAMLQPVGGYKGYGAAVCIEVLAAVLSGYSLMSTDIKDPDYNNTGHIFMAIDPTILIDLTLFYERINHLIDCIKASDLMDGVECVYLPGEQSYLRAKENAEKGLPYKQQDFSSIISLGQKLGIPSPKQVHLEMAQ